MIFTGCDSYRKTITTMMLKIKVIRFENGLTEFQIVEDRVFCW